MSTQPPPLPFSEPPVPPGQPEPAAPAAEDDGLADLLHTTCSTCGSQLEYAPGTSSLKCQSCGGTQQIEATDAVITEHSFDAWQSRNGMLSVAAVGAVETRCQTCGAHTETTNLSGACQFCGGSLVVVDQPDDLVQPEAVIPFHVDGKAAKGHFREWVGSRWFAPNELKKVGSTEALKGTYIPHWTFDAQTDTDYVGQRGDYYYVTKTRTVSDGNGGTRTETYQERRTRWRHASGRVDRFFDDVVVVASNHLDRKRLKKMGPWELHEAKPFQPEYLSGYSTLRYDVDPGVGSDEARQEMQKVIRKDVERDIGGDEQRVSQMDVRYSAAMFKLILMPLWIATYLYNGKTWQVLVNANTGEVVGDRPWSIPKIIAAVVAALVVIGIIVALVMASRQ